MEFELGKIEEVEQAILKEFNKKNITFNSIVACRDKGLLENFIEVINNVTKDYYIKFEIENLLIDEYILLNSSNNIKLIITNFYMNLIIEG